MRQPSCSNLLHVALRLGALVALPAFAAEDPLKTSLEWDALGRDFKITAAVMGDVDGDGSVDTVLTFRDQEAKSGASGGVVILLHKGAAYRNGGCLYLDGNQVADASMEDNALTLSLVKGEEPDDAAKKLILHVGKDIPLRGSASDPFAQPKISASSSLPNHPAAAAYDGDFTTSWAESARGTGIGESLSFEFPKPVDLGMVAVLGGRATSPKEFKETNRVHRMVLEVKTSSTSGDEAANLDFADLGINAAGNKTEVTLANKPELKFIPVVDEEATRLTLLVDSVFLGDKKDDTHVAEVAFCPLLTDARVKTLLKQQKKKAATPAVKAP